MDIEKVIKDYYYKLTMNELKLMNHDEDDWSISYNSLLYLELINMIPECTGSMLAELLGISKSAVTLKINELIKLGHVIKEQSNQDKRVYYLRVSKENEEVYAQYDKSLNTAVKRIKKKYGEKELNIFCDVLSNISAEYFKDLDDEE